MGPNRAGGAVRRRRPPQRGSGAFRDRAPEPAHIVHRWQAHVPLRRLGQRRLSYGRVLQNPLAHVSKAAQAIINMHLSFRSGCTRFILRRTVHTPLHALPAAESAQSV